MPSLDIVTVQDNNLNYSIEDPMSDRVSRVSPELALQLESARLAVRGSYGIDSERFATHSNLDNNKARERGGLSLQYRATPRFTFAVDGGYISTTTSAELNTETGLAASRLRGHRMSTGSSFAWRYSQRIKLEASSSIVKTSVENGIANNSRVAALVLTRQMSPNDSLRFDLERGDLLFVGETRQTIATQTLVAGWQHELSERAHWSLRIGPRSADGRTGVDIAASIGRSGRTVSTDFSVRRTQTTVIGYAGVVDTQVAEGKLSYTPSRHIIAYAAPAFIRSTRDGLEGSVIQLALGARYSLTSMAAFDVAYHLDHQNGAIDPLRADTKFSHAILSIGFSTRYSR